jgi:hypothetical protein
MVLALYWLAAGEINLPALSWALASYSVFYWLLMALVVLLFLFCLLIAAGGFICLHDDARENKCA